MAAKKKQTGRAKAPREPQFASQPTRVAERLEARTVADRMSSYSSFCDLHARLRAGSESAAADVLHRYSMSGRPSGRVKAKLPRPLATAEAESRPPGVMGACGKSPRQSRLEVDANPHSSMVGNGSQPPQ